MIKITEVQILAVSFILIFFVAPVVSCAIYEKVRAIRERRRKKQAYISHIEKQNLQLRRTVNFLRFQAELNCEKAGDPNGSVHTVRE